MILFESIVPIVCNNIEFKVNIHYEGKHLIRNFNFLTKNEYKTYIENSY